SSVCNDNSGNVYVGGMYASNPCYIGNDSLQCVPMPPQRGFFLAKYNSSGSIQWLHGYKGTNEDSLNAGISDMAYDAANNYIYVCGSFSGSGNIDSVSLSAAGGTYILLAKFDLNGNCIWAKKAGGAGCGSFATALCVDADGNIIITGENLCSATFDTITVPAGFFLAKYDGNGNCLWAKKKFNQNMSAQGFDALLFELKAYGTDIIGFGGFTLDTLTVDTTTVQSNYANGQYLLIRFDSIGNTKWAKGCAGDFTGSGIGLAEDSSGNSYITGSFAPSAIFENDTLYNNSGDLFFAKYNSSGNFAWAIQAYATANTLGNALAIGNNNAIYLTGAFQDSATFGNNTIISTGTISDMFVARYDASGNYIGVVQVAEAGGASISLDSNNSIYVTGTFRNTATFGTNPSITSYGFSDIFVAKIDGITGEEEAPRLSGSNQLFIYANPTTGICNVTIPNEFKHEKDLTLQIFDNTGKLLQQIPVQMDNEKVRLNLEQEARGVYHITLSNGRKKYNGTIVFE
ncbi:MAG TPA: T9SS type A sorting domain-containing protein, partial [Chitinophagaceae bacterium]|nr:T9SS type A sorting domain-containing protein [Chitinophagaceae bacterium]